MNRLILFVSLLYVFNTSAQNISLITINSGGAVYKNLDYSIGESSSIAFFQVSNQFNLNSGFIQSYNPLVTGIINRLFEEGESLVLSPNPAINYVRIKGALLKPGFVEFQLIDLQGRLLETITSTYCINYLEKEINTSSLTEGTYFIRLIYSSSDGIHQTLSFKFSKII